MKALVASGAPLGSSGHTISVAELDKALAAANLPTADRIRLKMALSAQRLLASTDRKINSLGRL